MSSAGEMFELKLPASALAIADVMSRFAGSAVVAIYSAPSASEESYLGTVHGPTALELINLPMAAVRKFGAGHFYIIGRAGERVVATVHVDADDPPLVHLVHH